ncbi:MAG: ABC transporter permease subunit [Candidatus Rokuibacteriota bacterium]
MADGTQTLAAGGPTTPPRPFVLRRSHTHRRILADRWASRLVVVGGVVIIASILTILVVIVAEVRPVFRAPTAELAEPPEASDGALALRPAGPDALGVDEYRELAYIVGEEGALLFLSLRDRRGLPPVAVPELGAARVSAVGASGHTRYLIGTSDGRAIPLDVRFDVAFSGGTRTITPQPVFGEPVVLDPGLKRPVRHVAFATAESGPVTVALVGSAELVLQTIAERKALIGPSARQASLVSLPVAADGDITRLKLDGRAEDLFAGTSRGQVIRYDLRDRARPVRAETVDVTRVPGTPVTALEFLIGDRTLVVGDGAGGVSTWQIVAAPGAAERRLTRVHEFQTHAGPVVSISASRRDKGFVTADAGGGVALHYGTSGETLLTLTSAAGARAVAFAPKADGLLVADARGRLSHWRLRNPHPEITLRTLFGKVRYEGYSAPAYVWQSTGGTDDFEAKFSLTPLIYGTLKGTFYALLFAVPLALLAALYVSEFMHPSVKAYVKPVVEIMAALPSVVLGFLAGLWLAPLVERIVPGLFLIPLVLPLVILLVFLAWRLVPTEVRGYLRPGTEALLLTPFVLAGAWLAFVLGGLVEATLLGGNYRGWLLSALGLTYDQRNSLVVGVAMGFAVVPIIFTIAEDSLANVPRHLRAGSLALGATRWQTALRIVLPTASPGIFSAIMIGFGRAVGETMIVLMATGNTPIMEWSLFNGFRALSANVAVELPEAPEGGTLFRVLFLAALLLFCLTFAVNTVAELVRLRLRRRYRYL